MNNFAHIFISVIALSILGVAGAQALLLSFQHYALRQKRFGHIVQFLPPLQTMEHLLFQIIKMGFVLLSASLITGFLFLNHLSFYNGLQKTLFSLLAWGLFVILLFGHYRFGWRGPTAVRLTLSGVFVLSFAYFGTKFIMHFQI